MLDELGCTEEDAHRCTVALRPVIQELLNNTDTAIVIASITKAYFHCLREAGATDEQCDVLASKTEQFEQEYSRSDLRNCYKALSRPLGRLLIKQKMNPLAAAYSFVGAIGSIFDNIEQVTEADKLGVVTTLLTNLNDVRALKVNS